MHAPGHAAAREADLSGHGIVNIVAPFAGIERLVNAGAAALLANAVAQVDGGEPFGVVFERTPAVFDAMVESTGPTASFDLAKAPTLAMDSPLVIDGVAWYVAGGLTPDASGWVTVRLSEGR